MFIRDNTVEEQGLDLVFVDEEYTSDASTPQVGHADDSKRHTI